jgi:methyl-accepting chemotaxis protein
VAGEAITQLASSINESAQITNQIAITAQQQLTGMDQLTIAIENIKVAATQNMNSTKQAEIAAQTLHSLGQRLKASITRYKVS